jgi:predicted transcriptional regulator
VLDALWECDHSQSVRDLQAHVRGVAYTTLMTTLDRLHRKGVLEREKSGRAFVYRPRYSRDVLQSQLAGEALQAVFGARASDLQSILSFFVETVSREDRDALDALERLIAERRRARTEEPE